MDSDLIDYDCDMDILDMFSAPPVSSSTSVAEQPEVYFSGVGSAGIYTCRCISYNS